MPSVSERVRRIRYHPARRGADRGVCFSAKQKVEIAQALAAMRVDVIEAGFPPPSSARARRRERRGARGARRVGLRARARSPFDVDAAAEALQGAEARASTRS